MPHEKWGESGVAVLVLAPGRMQLTERNCRRISTAGWRRYKWPARFVIWPELPKSGYGKVTKRDVKHLLEKDV